MITVICVKKEKVPKKRWVHCFYSYYFDILNFLYGLRTRKSLYLLTAFRLKSLQYQCGSYIHVCVCVVPVLFNIWWPFPFLTCLLLHNIFGAWKTLKKRKHFQKDKNKENKIDIFPKHFKSGFWQIKAGSFWFSKG